MTAPTDPNEGLVNPNTGQPETAQERAEREARERAAAQNK
jgi:hypothetical protein